MSEKNIHKTTKIPSQTWFVIIMLSLAGQIAWSVENSWFNTFVFDTITPNPTPVALMVAVSAITATVTTLVMGTFSDRKGRRKPFLLWGYMLWGLTTAIFPMSAYIKVIGLAIAMVVILDALMTFFGSTANDAVFNAWMTDITDKTNRGRVMGAIAVIPLLTTGLTAAIGGLVIDNLGYYAFFYGLGGFVLLAGLISGPLVKESPDLKPNDSGTTFWKQVWNVFEWETFRNNRTLFLIFTYIMIVAIADQITLPYLFIYLENFVGISKSILGTVILMLTLIAGVASYIFGNLLIRWDRRSTAIILGSIYAAGVFIFSLLRSVPTLFVLGTLYVVPMMLIRVLTGSWSMDLYPAGSRGQFQGVRMIFQVMIPMMIGPLIGSFIIAQVGIPTVLNGQAGFIPTSEIYWANALVALLAVIPLLFIPRKVNKSTA
ncbi:MAG: MFS transporter [Chloroflexota bacterium]|nr:MFS transporter [Chloroflexota bacterium]